jgi:hypothetical protein
LLAGAVLALLWEARKLRDRTMLARHNSDVHKIDQFARRGMPESAFVLGMEPFG